MLMTATTPMSSSSTATINTSDVEAALGMYQAPRLQTVALAPQAPHERDVIADPEDQHHDAEHHE